MTCQFDNAYAGLCKKECDGMYCPQHDGLACCSCGEQATHACDETLFLVCGYPLCDNCEHKWNEKEKLNYHGKK